MLTGRFMADGMSLPRVITNELVHCKLWTKALRAYEGKSSELIPSGARGRASRYMLLLLLLLLLLLRLVLLLLLMLLFVAVVVVVVVVLPLSLTLKILSTYISARLSFVPPPPLQRPLLPHTPHDRLDPAPRV